MLLAIKRWWYKLWCPRHTVYDGLAPMSITAGWCDESGCFMKSEFKGRGYTPWYKRTKR